MSEEQVDGVVEDLKAFYRIFQAVELKTRIVEYLEKRPDPALLLAVLFSFRATKDLLAASNALLAAQKRIERLTGVLIFFTVVLVFLTAVLALK
ncbi:MAG: hypothetical protein ACFFER_12870 [Candidatus Thorarchaeota archaeon]